MKTFKNRIKSFKVLLLIISMVIIFSFGFNTVSAADTSPINESSSDYNVTTEQIVTDLPSTSTDLSNSSTSTLASTKSEPTIQPTSDNQGSSNLLNSTLPDPQIYRNGVLIGSYYKIADAIAAAQSGDTIMLDGATFNECGLVISKDLSFNVINNGHATIDAKHAATIFIINPGIRVQIQNITFKNGQTNYGGAIVNNGGYLYLTECIFLNNLANGGGAIFNNGGLVSVLSSTFTGNRATDNGGAIENYGNLYIYGSTFSGNTALYGGVIYNSGVMSVTGSCFTNNFATHNGGVIHNNKYYSWTIDNSWFQGNRADYGGVFYTVKGGPLTVMGSTFTGNCAINGAAIYYDRGGSLTVSGSTFTNNIASWDGGAIYNYVGGPFTVTGCNLSYNKAFGGGAIHNAGTLTVTNSNFTGNYGTNDGGAIENVYGGGIYPFTIYDSYFTSNYAINGGAIFNNEGEPLNIHGVIFTRNHANKYGGAIVNDYSLGIDSCTFTKNWHPTVEVLYTTIKVTL